MASNGNGHDDLVSLKEAARRFSEELAAAEKVVARLRPAVLHLTSAVAALEEQKAGPIVKIPVKTNGRNGAVAGRIPRQTFPSMPKRPPYQKTSLVEAIKAELQKSSVPLHHDELTRKIFEVDPDHFWRAKQCCTSTLTHGAKKGAWARLPDGRYTLGAGEGIEPRSAAAR